MRTLAIRVDRLILSKLIMNFKNSEILSSEALWVGVLSWRDRFRSPYREEGTKQTRSSQIEMRSSTILHSPYRCVDQYQKAQDSDRTYHRADQIHNPTSINQNSKFILSSQSSTPETSFFASL